VLNSIIRDSNKIKSNKKGFDVLVFGCKPATSAKKP
jgi:hypothetical protein